MPGGRLTHQERLEIAEGLVEGLTYTEIAGRLGRPISTVTREVARNGGAGAYRADAAQRSTIGRARRGKQAPAAAASNDLPGDGAHGRDPEAVHELEERFTALMVGTGLPRMTARVLTCLYVTDHGSLTATELAQRLKVSPASISKAVGELEQQELIRRERDPGRRRDRYVIDADAWFRGWMASARQNTVLADFARQSARTLGATTPAGTRMQDIGQFFEHVGQAMIRAAEEWRRGSAATTGEFTPTERQAAGADRARAGADRKG
ncbi:MarR family transcriptional regulator [Streptomyces sp. WM6372]|uniref:GbsR/MarR family transcriptional regulator n=1 Tax=Streptomyces sp. WM6372 TaxID=1415555 RepID=UPI0006AE940C|nr:helix-turn-helix domain-containing protein [Streptomyces sp. WM6372]KOU18108.1 MarR family transcriptional regulator [Streptomyces sp. WM6372]